MAEAYNTASAGFDADTRRFFQTCARRLVSLMALDPTDKVIDLATGTGAAAFAAAGATAPGGSVIGVDIAAKMLEQARQTLSRSGLPHVEFLRMDAERLGFDAECFDAAICAFSIFYMPDLRSALQEWRRVLRPRGSLGFSSFTHNAFQPLSDLYEARARQYRAELPQPKAFAWQRLTSPEACSGWLEEAGFRDVQVGVEQHGYFLRDAHEWWQIVWNGSWRQALAHLNSEQIEQFKLEHLAEIQRVATDKGVWLDVEAIFATGRKP